MQLTFSALKQTTPDDGFARLFRRAWPHYRRWWLQEGEEARPSYLASRRAIANHMPEMLPLWERLCELAGGGDPESRFLSLYCPPAYQFGCSQAVWPGREPLLVRNYDYDPRAFDALLLHTNWLGRHAVLGMSDCLIGLLDGVNDAGLTASLTFGGQRLVGVGFGIPIVLRYVLETCSTAAEAGRTLARIPSHMAYNVTALDAQGERVTVMIAPGAKAVVTNAPVATNHQQSVAWHSHARATASVERERFLLRRLTLHPEPADRFVAEFLRPPLYSTAFEHGFGTLYTAAYWPGRAALALEWPADRWELSVARFAEGRRTVEYLSGGMQAHPVPG
ncbi:MAG: C45 family peptidase [Woeseiaceae bacterium]